MIEEFFAQLPAEVLNKLEPLFQQAQRNYRRARLQDPKDSEKRYEFLGQFPPAVFKTQAAKRLKSRVGDFDDFQRSIGLEGGDGELAMRYTRRLYHALGLDREFIYCRGEIEQKLERWITEAGDLWFNPDLVPEGWAKFLDNSASSTDGSPDSPSTDHEIAPSPEADRKAPSEFFLQYRARNPQVTYKQLAPRIGISPSTLYKIKDETAWVRDDKYEAAAGVLKCAAADLHPRVLKRALRHEKTRHK
jgi:hypothetical protein